MRLQVELLEDFDFLLFAGGEVADQGPRVDAEGHCLHEVFELLGLRLPVDDGRHVLAGHDQVFDDGHVLDEREVLVDHADAEGMSLPRILELDLLRPTRTDPVSGR